MQALANGYERMFDDGWKCSDDNQITTKLWCKFANDDLQPTSNTVANNRVSDRFAHNQTQNHRTIHIGVSTLNNNRSVSTRTIVGASLFKRTNAAQRQNRCHFRQSTLESTRTRELIAKPKGWYGP
jgi:hypothetical protein